MLGRVANLAGGSSRVEIYFKEEGNTATIGNAQKALINSEAPYNRNPFHLKPGHKGVVTKKLQAGISKALRGHTYGAGAMTGTLQSIGQYLVDLFKKQLVGMDYQKGHKDLSSKYKKWKTKRKGGAYPILLLHGDLLKSISYRVVK